MNLPEENGQCQNELAYAEHLKQSVNEIDSLIQNLSSDSLEDHDRSCKIEKLKTLFLSILDKSPDSIRKSKAQIIIRSVIFTISGCGDYILKLDDLNAFINEVVLKKTCDLIRFADHIQLLKIEKTIYDFIINTWAKKCVFQALEFASHLYTFICKIGPPKVGEELVQNFSILSMPFYVKIYIQPCLLIAAEDLIVNSSSSTQSLLNEFDGLVQLTLKGRKIEQVRIETVVSSFWKSLLKNWQTKFSDAEAEIRYWDIITSFCVKTAFLISDLEVDNIKLVIQTVNSKFLSIPKQAGVQNAVLILLSLLQLKDLTVAPYWENIVELCQLIVGTSINLSREKKNRDGAYFGVKAVSFFLNSTGPSEEVIDSFASILSNYNPPKEAIKSDGKDGCKKVLNDLENVVKRLQNVKKFSSDEKSRVTSLANILLNL